MKKVLLITVLTFAVTFNFIFAQEKLPLINPAKIIEEASILSDSGKFDEAIKTLLTIEKSDTSYIYMLTELASTYLVADKYKEAIQTANEALKSKSKFRLRLNLIKGNALDQSGSPDSAVEVYKTALKKFPYSYLVYYNLGVTYSGQKKYEQSLKSFQQALKLNPFNASSHLAIGKISALMGHYTHAILSLETFLIIEPNTGRSNPNLVFLNNFLNNALDPSNEKIAPIGKNAFEDLDEILKSGIANNSGYKLKIDFNAPVTRQSQLFFESLEYKEKTGDYWMDTYVPIFKAVKQNEFFQPFMYRILTSSPDKTIASQLKKQDKKIKEMNKLLGSLISKIHTNYVINENGKERSVDIFLNDDDYLISIGKYKDDGETHYGHWSYYFTNAELKEDGNYNDDGKLEGKWLTYNNEGTLLYIENYKNGQLEGDYIGYYPSGNKRFESNYVNNVPEGIVRYFFDCDAVSSFVTFKNGSRNGKGMNYYKNGVVKEDFFYKNDSLESEDKNFYPSGSIKWVYNYSSNKLTGKAIYYYRNGKIEKEYEYVNNKLNGPYKEYYSNGTLSNTGSYEKGNLFGEWKESNSKGIVTEITNFDEKGKLDGEMKGFDDNGKPYYVYLYDKGKVKQYSYFNSSGATIASGKPGSGETKMKGYYADGNQLCDGNYKNGIMDGNWTYYYKSGIKKSVKIYKDAILNGPMTNFYKTGEISEESNYKDGELDGYYRKLNTDAFVLTEGWYRAGEQEGKWVYRNQDGTIESTCYFISGKLNGDYDNYAPDQKLKIRRSFISGEIATMECFDPSGKTVSKVVFDGKTDYVLPNLDGTIMSSGNYKCNELNSKYKFVYKNGKTEVETDYLDGLKDGAQKAFYPSGKLKREGNYINNNREGIWKYYNEIGMITKIACYKNDEPDSTLTTYHDNGKLKTIVKYEDGLITDTARYYNPLGEFMFAIIYDPYGITGYQYESSTGMKNEIISIKDTGSFVTYYKNGQISSKQSYKYGSFQGARTFYFSNGRKYLEELVQDDINNGKLVEYYANGKIKKVENYLKDDYHGTFQNYREDGTIESSREYKYDDNHGTFIYYDNKGNKEKTETYWGDIQL